MMPLVTELRETCGGCPSQWEGKTEGGQPVYIRYRYGWLSAEVNDVEIFGEQLGGLPA
jgi:hypothetical protein